jgi:hypothetical protein
MANMRILSLHIATIYILGVFGEDSTLNPGFDDSGGAALPCGNDGYHDTPFTF